MRPVGKRTDYALSMVGSRSLSGMCEKFTRLCFGFEARYGSALLAWQATERRHADIYNAPEGVPLFANLHPANPNYRYGHVWYSLGGGYSVTTSAGPGRSIAKVRTRDLVQAWGMSPLGWTEDYHRQTIWTPPAKTGVSPITLPSPTKNPTAPIVRQEDIMASLAQLEQVVGASNALHADKIRTAVQEDITRLVDDIVRKRDNTQNTALHNMVRRELALAIGATPGIDAEALASRVAGLLEDDLIDAVVQAVSAHPAADREQIKAEVREDIANRLTQEA